MAACSSVSGILQARGLEWVAISFSNACRHAKLLQLCLTLCDPMDSSPPGSPIHGILHARYWSGLPFIPRVISSWTTGGSVEICKECGIIWIKIWLWFLINPISLVLSFYISQMVMMHLPHKTMVKFEV